MDYLRNDILRLPLDEVISNQSVQLTREGRDILSGRCLEGNYLAGSANRILARNIYAAEKICYCTSELLFDSPMFSRQYFYGVEGKRGTVKCS